MVKQETEQRSNEKRAIKGTVLDESGIPIIGANVMQGKGTGVITDINGNFTIVADPNQPLTVSYSCSRLWLPVRKTSNHFYQ